MDLERDGPWSLRQTVLQGEAGRAAADPRGTSGRAAIQSEQSVPPILGQYRRQLSYSCGQGALVAARPRVAVVPRFGPLVCPEGVVFVVVVDFVREVPPRRTPGPASVPPNPTQADGVSDSRGQSYLRLES